MRHARVAVLSFALLILALPSAVAAPDAQPDASKIDINTAGVEELQGLPGIGPSLARRIVEHRREHGPFARPEDLLEVKGIGEKTLARFRHRIRASQSADR